MTTNDKTQEIVEELVAEFDAELPIYSEEIEHFHIREGVKAALSKLEQLEPNFHMLLDGTGEVVKKDIKDALWRVPLWDEAGDEIDIQFNDELREALIVLAEAME